MFYTSLSSCHTSCHFWAEIKSLFLTKIFHMHFLRLAQPRMRECFGCINCGYPSLSSLSRHKAPIQLILNWVIPELFSRKTRLRLEPRLEGMSPEHTLWPPLLSQVKTRPTSLQPNNILPILINYLNYSLWRLAPLQEGTSQEHTLSLPLLCPVGKTSQTENAELPLYKTVKTHICALW